jgi:outer membrane protein assembly factor BamE (lipoprotein component of BamABCDE complex)
MRSTVFDFLESVPRRLGLLVPATLVLAACVYRIDIQQGNLLKDKDIAQVEVGMTRSQVQFLLGTPMVSDSFHRDRWDYAYYLQKGRSPETERRWVVVYFNNDRVSRIERDLTLQPTAAQVEPEDRHTRHRKRHSSEQDGDDGQVVEGRP